MTKLNTSIKWWTFLFAVGVNLMHTQNICEAKKETWNLSSCKRSILGILQLPNDNYFSGHLLELIDGIFGPAFYLRSVESCSHVFAVPLPFSIQSVTYQNGYFFAIRDDVEFDESTLYSIPDYDLIGGYLFWLQEAEKQCNTCNLAELLPIFDFDDLHTTCNITSDTDDKSICSVNLDTLFVKERITLPLQLIKQTGLVLFNKLLEKFNLVHALPADMRLQEKAWFWTKWTEYQSNPNHFTSVHSVAYLNFLMVNQPSFQVMQINSTLNPPLEVTIRPVVPRFITITSCEYGNTVMLIGIDIYEDLHIVELNSWTSSKIGKLSVPYQIQQLFVISGNVLVGLDESYNVYISEDYIPDILYHYFPCGPDAIVSSDGCSFRYQLPSSFTMTLNEVCKAGNGIHEDAPERFIHNNGHHFYFMSSGSSYHDAAEKCSLLSDENESSRLAVIEDENLLHSIINFVKEHYVTTIETSIISFWIGASLNENNEWTWLDGTRIQNITNADLAVGGGCLTLSTTSQGSVNIALRSSPCLAKFSYICEKFRVCWDIYPNIGANFSALVEAARNENLTFLFDFGQLPALSKDPVADCAELCQQKIDEGCIFFTYISKNIPTSLSGSCFGRKKHPLYFNISLPFANQYTGVLRTCKGSTIKDTKIIESETALSNEIPISCSATAEQRTANVFAVTCPRSCSSITTNVIGTKFYAYTSSICQAAIHNGKINDSGGKVTVYQTSGSVMHVGSTQNGINSSSVSARKSFMFDSNTYVPYAKCALPADNVFRECAAKNTIEATCKGKGCCSLNIDGDTYCFYPLPTGPRFTLDRWLKNPYNSYEYSIIQTPSHTMQQARTACQDLGGELAYSGILEETVFKYLDDHLVIGDYNVRFWIGVIRDGSSETFTALNGDFGTFFQWREKEPDNQGGNENCVMTWGEGSVWYDVPCSNTIVPSTLCQRLNYHCAMPTELRVACDGILFEDIDKSTCLANDCCFEELINGTNLCYQTLKPGPKFPVDRWLKTPYSSYEFSIIHTPSKTMQEARTACQDLGGELAYSGIVEKPSYKYLIDNLIINYTHHDFHMWIGLVRDKTSGSFVALNGDSGVMNWRPGEPSNAGIMQDCVILHKQTNGEMADVSCSWTGAKAAMCQRMSYRCNVPKKARTPCVLNSYETVTKLICLANGCCFDEEINGNGDCYTALAMEKEDETETWWQSPFNEYEYTVVTPPLSGHDQARQTCREKGGDIAFSGLFNSSEYTMLHDSVVSPYEMYSSFIWLGITDIASEGNIIALDGLTAYGLRFDPTQPAAYDQNCFAATTSNGYLHNVTCNFEDVKISLCQRLKGKSTWWSAPYNDHEYVLTDYSRTGSDSSKLACMDRGGSLAHIDIENTPPLTLQQMFNKIISHSAKHSFEQDACMHVINVNSTGCDNGNCSNSQKQVAVCERKKGVTQVTCKSSKVEYCLNHQQFCHSNAHCSEREGWGECVCNKGFIGDGEDCIRLYDCQEGWTEFSTGCYIVKMDDATFYEAEQDCQSMGAHLISINSEEEYNNFKKLLQSYDNRIRIWIGLRNSYSWVSRNGEEHSDCGLWTDGSVCEYNDINLSASSNYKRECHYYFQNLWQPYPCFSTLNIPSATIPFGFVCEMPMFKPHSLKISMISLPWYVYPGGAEMKINGKVVQWRQDGDVTKGCIYITTLTYDGVIVENHSVCNDDINAAKSQLSSISETFMEKPEELYFAVATGGRIDFDVWEHFASLMTSHGISLHTLSQTDQESTKSISNQDFAESSLGNKAALYACESCSGDCVGASVFRAEDGLTKCRGYLLEPQNNRQYEYAVTSVSWEEPNQDEKNIAFRSKTIKNSTTESKLSCPWLTEDIKSFGINLDNVAIDEKNMSARADCASPPCVQQIACRRPGRISDKGAMQLGNPDMFLVLYEKIPSTARYILWFNEKGYSSDGVLRASKLLRVVTGLPILVTFDDLNELGSPPFEFGSIYGRNLTWRPLLWNWKENTYATLIPGVRNRAFRFKNEEVHTKSEPCFWKLGTNLCPFGFTMSFWIRVVSWPTTNDKVIINTGAWGRLGDCTGVTVYVSAATHKLVVMVKSSNKMWLPSFSIQKEKWTHIVVRWKISKMLVLVDRQSTLHPVYTDNLTSTDAIITCSHAALSVGSNTSDDAAVFDLDELLIFTYAVFSSKLQEYILISDLPLRHYLANEAGLPSGSNQFIGSSPCETSSISSGCGKFGLVCSGSTIYCENGFNAAFRLKLLDDPATEFYNDKDHIMILTNLPDTAYYTDIASISKSLGFRVSLTRSNEIKDGVKLWNVKFFHTFSGDSIPELQLGASWFIEPDVTAFFWLQFYPDGLWSFCYRWPTNCKHHQSSSVFTAYEQFSGEETFTEVHLGPVLLHYMEDDSTVNSSPVNFVTITNVWIIEQAYDIVMMADETNKLALPFHWQAEETNFMTKQGHAFNVMGETTRSYTNYSGPIGRRVGVKNYADDLIPLLESGSDIDSVASWLEIPYTDLSIIPCLHDIENCDKGFTIQFWLIVWECKKEVSLGDCYYISTGGQPTSISRGFAFYRTPDKNLYHVIVSTAKKVWRISKDIDLSSEYGLIRISWENEQGLSLFLNDVPIYRQSIWESVSRPNAKTDAKIPLDNFQSIAIGKRNDLPEGFSVFEFGEMHFWEGTVEGMPFDSLGAKCLSDWFQAGETCYKILNGRELIEDARTKCSEVQASLAYVPSLAMYNVLSSFLEISSINDFWIDIQHVENSNILNWDFLGRSVASMNFHAMDNLIKLTSVDIGTAGQLIVRKRSGARYRRVLWYWLFVPSNSRSSVICASPLNKDPFLRGCYDAAINLVPLGFDSSASVSIRETVQGVSTNSWNNLGSYNLPHNCRRLCLLRYKSEVSAVTDNKCYCLDESVSLENFSQIITPKYMKSSQCAATDFLGTQDELSFGYSALNFPPQGNGYDYSIKREFCGPLETGGAYRCGALANSNLRASVYGFNTAKSDEIFEATSAVSNVAIHLSHEETDLFVPLTITLSDVKCCPANLEIDSDCTCLSSLLVKIDFGNGDNGEYILNYEEVIGFSSQHFYEAEGIYTVFVEVSNTIESKPAKSKTFVKILPHVDKVELNFIKLPITQPWELAEVATEGLSGSHMNCKWTYGDLSPPEEIYLEQLPIPNTNHRFEQPGVYIVSALCGNRLQGRVTKTNAIVHEFIQTISVHTDVVVPFGRNYTHNWRIARGSGIDCNVYLGNYSLPEATTPPSESTNESGIFYFNKETNEGYAHVPDKLFLSTESKTDECFSLGEAITYTVVVICYNAVTDPVASAITYVTIETPVHGLSLDIMRDTPYLLPDETFCVESRIEGGSNVILRLDWGLVDKDIIVQYCGNDECGHRKSCFAYTKSGSYTIRLDAFNANSSLTATVQVYVEIPIVSYNIRLVTYLFPNQPSEVFIIHSPPLPSGFVQLNFGDEGGMRTVPMSFDEETNEMMASYRYDAIGFYKFSAYGYNNVSSYNASAEIKIGIPIKDVKISLITPGIARTFQDTVVFHTEIGEGSEPQYHLNFDDGSDPVYARFNETITRLGPDYADIHTVEHIYQLPGNYVVSFEVKNLFGKVEMSSDKMVKLQNPLAGSKFMLVADEVDIIKFPPGTATFKAHLIKNDFFNFNVSEDIPIDGWANNVHITWIHSSKRGYITLSQGYGHHDLDLFPNAFKFERDHVGGNTILAKLSNLVSNIELEYKFTLVEVLEGLLLNVIDLDNPSATHIENVQDGDHTNISVGSKITFRTLAMVGSHATFTINYGDGHVDSKASPVLFANEMSVEFSHEYESEGVFSLSLTASNHVGNLTRTFSGFANVFEIIGKIANFVQYVDFDETLSNVDVFKDSAETYALVYGTPGILSDKQILLFPLNRIITWRAGVLQGTNVSITWYFEDVNVIVYFKRVGDDYDMTVSNSLTGVLDVGQDGIILTEKMQIKFLNKLTSFDLQYLGAKIKEKYDDTEYRAESHLMTRFFQAGQQSVNVLFSNEVSTEWKNQTIDLMATIEDITFSEFEPPVVNRTFNITFTINQLGSNSCIVVDPGDLSTQIAFGIDEDYCLDNGISPEIFFPFTEYMSNFSGRNYSDYNYTGNIFEGNIRMNLAIRHTYLQPAEYTIKVRGFNAISQTENSLDILATELLCDFPEVILEKDKENTVTTPRKSFSHTKFRLYALIKPNCKITSKTVITWFAYEIIDTSSASVSLVNPTKTYAADVSMFVELPKSLRSFSSIKYKFRAVPGLQFTPKSADISISPGDLKLGLHLICINAAMLDVPKIEAADCVYINIVFPPLVASISYGVKRAVGYKKVIEVDAASASYDPDKQTKPDVDNSAGNVNSSHLTFKWSCPFLLQENSPVELDDDEISLLFSGKAGWQSVSYCSNATLKCTNSFHVVHIQSASYTNHSAQINESSVFLTQVQELIKDACSERQSCEILPNKWLADYLIQIDANYTRNATARYCLDMVYKCDVSATPPQFQFVSSNASCISSGYYSTISGQSSDACSTISSVGKKSNCGNIMVNTSIMQPDKEYMVYVQVNDPITKRNAIASQIIQVNSKLPPKLRMVCLVNCEIKVNARTSISVRVQQVNEDGVALGRSITSLLSHTWRLFEVLEKRRFRRDVSQGENVDLDEVRNFEELTATGIHGNYMVIKPDVLQPLKKYRVRVESYEVGASSGLTEIEFIPNLPPYHGDCEVTPTYGYVPQETFTVLCKDWLDEGINVNRKTYVPPSEYSLTYQIYYQLNEDTQPSLISYGSNSEVQGLRFPPGLIENDYKVWIQVLVIDDYGAQAQTNTSVYVYETPDLQDDTLKNITQTQVSSSTSQNIAQLSVTVSAILNRQSNVSSGNVSTSVQETDEERSVTQERSALRTELIDAVVDGINPDSDLDGIEQSCNAIASLTTVPGEVAEKTQLNVVRVLSERTNLLSRLADNTASEDVEHTAFVVVVGLENTIQSARAQVVKDLERTDSHTSMAELPIFSQQAPSSHSPHLSLDEEEEFLSPEERLERREIQAVQKADLHGRNRIQAKRVGLPATNSMTAVAGLLTKKKVPGEPPVSISAKGLRMETQRSNPAELCRTLSLNESTNAAAPSPLTSILMSSNVQLGNCDDFENDDSIDTELLVLDDNPYIWDDSADSVRSSVVSFSLKSSGNGSESFQGTNNTFRLEIPVLSALSNIAPENHIFSPSGENGMSYHEITLNTPNDVTFLTIKPVRNISQDVITINVYFLYAPRMQMYPTTENFTFVRVLSQYDSASANQYRIRIDHSDLDDLGRYVYGIVEVDDIGNVTSFGDMSFYNYTLHNMKTSCRFWNETTEKWETTGCYVSDETTKEIVVCLCNHLTSFGADFLVAPNPIDFSSIAGKLQNLKDNLAVLMTIIALFILYIVGIIFCRRQDKRDVSKWSVTHLMDNNLCHTYYYQLTVKTGSPRDAQTSSRVYFVLGGEDGTTSLRTMADTQKTVFDKGSVRKFLVAVDKPLGALSYMRVWHDNSGKGAMASWFLEHVVVNDLRAKKTYYFFCDNWLAADQAEGSVERIMPVASDVQMGSFGRVFAASTKKDFSDGHLWFSLFSRPTKSNFTRVQRLSCGIAILFSTMLTSCMFYGSAEDDDSNEGALEIGPIKITIQQLVISIEASLIVIPVNILFVQLFRRIRQKEGAAGENANMIELLRRSDVSLDTDESNQQNNEKKTLTFPHWVIYINWTLLLLVTLASATFVFLYSVDWGAKKSQDWLLSIVMSLVQSIFVIQPVKVILGAILFSFFVNKFAKGKAEEIVGEDEQLEVTKEEKDEFKRKEEEFILQCPMEDDFDKINERMGEMDNERLAEARLRCKQHKVMVNTIHDIASYLFYLILLLIAANSTKDPLAYRFYRSLSDVFLTNEDPMFEQVRTHSDFWNWCDSTLLPGLHASPWYNGKRITWMQSRYISNRATFVAGPARIRQLRVEEGECKTPDNFTLVTRQCVTEYEVWRQETRDFTPGWTHVINSTSYSNDPWSFQNTIDLGGLPFNGRLKLYDGGGYVATLGNTPRSSREKLQALKDQKWIDRYTAAIFIEFTVYNANINMFASFVLLLERAPNGVFFGYPCISPIRLYDFLESQGYINLAIYVIFLLTLVYNIYQMAKKIKVQKVKFLNDFWNCVDICCAILSIIAVMFYILRFLQANSTLNKITADAYKETFVNFQFVTLWHDTFRYLVAFTVFLVTIKFSKLLRFNRRIRLLALTLSHAATPVLYFTIMFGMYFAAFMFLAHLWFEQKLYAFSSPYLSAEELFSMLLGRFDFAKLQTADQLLGPLFFIGFTGILTIALLNMFVAILDESIKKARVDLEAAQNEFEVVEYMFKRLTEAYHTYAPKFVLDMSGKDDEEDPDAPVYIEHPEEILELRIDALADRVRKIEKEFYADVSLEELEEELLEMPDMEDMA